MSSRVRLYPCVFLLPIVTPFATQALHQSLPGVLPFSTSEWGELATGNLDIASPLRSKDGKDHDWSKIVGAGGMEVTFKDWP